MTRERLRHAWNSRAANQFRDLIEKICGKEGAKNVKWFKNPCPRAGTIGYCEVPRNDTITQVVYCYKKQGIPDKQRLGFCKQTCKGRFAAY
jgi:hypothetical protein